MGEVIYNINYTQILHIWLPVHATHRSPGQLTVMWHALSTSTLNCAGLPRWPLFVRSKSPRHPVNARVGSLGMSDTATPPISCNPHDTSRGLHGIGWVGPPSHLLVVGFFGEAIEPSRKPSFRKFTRNFLVSLGRRVQAKLSDTFALLLMTLKEDYIRRRASIKS